MNFIYKEVICERRKCKEQMLYRLQNKDIIKERKHANYEANKEQLNRKDICECVS